MKIIMDKSFDTCIQELQELKTMNEYYNNKIVKNEPMILKVSDKIKMKKKPFIYEPLSKLEFKKPTIYPKCFTLEESVKDIKYYLTNIQTRSQ